MSELPGNPHNQPSDQETYSAGYDSVLTLKHHASRTARVQAKWFLPYLKPGMALLDCGCGSGSITIGLAEAVAPGQVTGVDISEIEIERAKERATSADSTNLRFRQANLYDLDFPDNTFDALFSHNVLEHLREPGKALQEMRRVLKPGGIIGIRDVDWSGNLLVPDEELIRRYFEIYEAYWTSREGSPHLGRRLRGLLTAAGFTDVEASASYDAYDNLESQQFISQIVGSRLVEQDFTASVLESALASQEELTAIGAAWSAWPDLPEAFLALAHGEAVARKV